MGLGAWLARRALAAFLFAPLVAFWVIVLWVVGPHSPPCLGPADTCEQLATQMMTRIYVISLVLAAITDWLIVRKVKHAMKEGSAYRRK